MEKFEMPDVSMMSNDDLVGLMIGCGMSNDPSDRMFAKGCAAELAKRKPKVTPTHHQSTEPEPVPSPAGCPPVAEGDSPA